MIVILLFKNLPLYPYQASTSLAIRPSGHAFLPYLFSDPQHGSLASGGWVGHGQILLVPFYSFSHGFFSLPHSIHCPGLHSGLFFHPGAIESWPALPPQHPCTPSPMVSPTHFDYFVDLAVYWPFVISHKLVDLFPQQVKVSQ